jgi:hypothetical protein
MMKLKLISLFFSVFFLSIGCSRVLPGSRSPSPTVSANQSAATSAEPFNYALYAEVLKQYVNETGLVDYRGLQSNSQPLRVFNQSLGEVSSAQFASWSEPDQIAFLINAYNAFTLQSIIDQDPIKPSIKDIPGVWRFRRFEVAGQSQTLDDIEHGTLRKNYSEPRIHAALNCTAISCPRLRTEPFTGDRLDTQLDEQVQQWLSSPQGLQIDRTTSTVSLSAIFDWFGEDWIPAYGSTAGFAGNDKQRSTLNFISNYVSPTDREYLQQGNYAIKYLEYDWALNSQN